MRKVNFDCALRACASTEQLQQRFCSLVSLFLNSTLFMFLNFSSNIWSLLSAEIFNQTIETHTDTHGNEESAFSTVGWILYFQMFSFHQNFLNHYFPKSRQFVHAEKSRNQIFTRPMKISNSYFSLHILGSWASGTWSRVKWKKNEKPRWVAIGFLYRRKKMENIEKNINYARLT